jgi:hypothetical protein
MSSRQQRLLTPELLKALEELRQNPDLIISHPDKGSGAVLLNRKEYSEKMNVILEDCSKFEKEKENSKDDPSIFEKRVCKEIQHLLEGHFLSETEAKLLRPHGTVTPELYGLPKLHKPDIPLRPIMSMNNSAQHKLAQWLVKKLEPVRRSIVTHSLRDTFQLVGELTNLNIQNTHPSSLDVNSLFTNVPLLETIQIICDHIEEQNINLGLPVTELERLIRLCTQNIKFKFQGQLYRQVDGVAMGSPLGPVLADIFMANLEQKLSDILSSVKFYWRYVDDTLLITRNKEEVVKILERMNTLHPNITLTIEHEDNDGLSFLDVRITRMPDGRAQRSVYHKQTWSGQYLHFHSFVPQQYKRCLVRTLFHRARQICSEDTLGGEIEHLQRVLRDNAYPQAFIEHHSKPLRPRPLAATVPKLKVYLKLPFKGDDVQELVRERLRTTVTRTYNCAVPILVSSTTRIPTPPVKSPLSSLDKSHVIYKFQCSCSDIYLGRTERALRQRVKEHVPMWLRNRIGQNADHQATSHPRNPSSSIARHLMGTGHCVKPEESFRVIFSTRHPRLLRFVEAVAIRKWSPTLCVQKDLWVTLALPW